MTSDLAPLIVAAALDPSSFTRFDALRRAHFPPERNVLAAHLTLFHHLPGADEAVITADLAAEAAARAPLHATASGLRSLGRGVAYDIDCPPLVALRSRLADLWRASLGAQDRSWNRPHVTVQNKVAPATARALLAELDAAFAPFPVRIDGLDLWRYLGGPWELVAEAPFQLIT